MKKKATNYHKKFVPKCAHTHTGKSAQPINFDNFRF